MMLPISLAVFWAAKFYLGPQGESIIINSIYYATFHNHLKVENPEGIKGEKEIKKNRTIDGKLVNWQETKGAKNALEGQKMKKKKKKNLSHSIMQGTAVKERTVVNN